MDLAWTTTMPECATVCNKVYVIAWATKDTNIQGVDREFNSVDPDLRGRI